MAIVAESQKARDPETQRPREALVVLAVVVGERGDELLRVGSINQTTQGDAATFDRSISA